MEEILERNVTIAKYTYSLIFVAYLSKYEFSHGVGDMHSNDKI